MKVLLYQGGLSLVGQSGVGQAVRHQRQALLRAGITPVADWHADAPVVHINTVLPDALLAARRARRQGRRVVYYGHSTMEDFRDSFCGSNLAAPLFRRWILHCYRQGDVVITPTAYSRRILLGYGLKQPVYSLSNGVDTSFFAPSPARRARFRQAYRLADDELAVISVGHLFARKGLPEYLELARSMPQVRFFWFGHTDRRLQPRAIRKAVANAPANVCFAGFADREALCDAYCGADAFAFMSHEETEGIVVLEALACGTPTVVRDIPVYSGWLRDGENVYMARDLDGFRERVAGLLTGGLPSLREAGRAVAQQRSLEAIGRRLCQIYTELGWMPGAPAAE